MKKVFIIVLTVVMCMTLASCIGGDIETSTKETSTKETSTKETSTEEVSKKEVDYSAVNSDIAEAIKNMDACASIQHDWLGVQNNLPYLYDDSNYTGGNNDQAKQAGTDCYEYRKTAKEKLESAKAELKNGSGDARDAVQDYYLAANEYLSFISNFPEGYNKITWGIRWNELKQACDAAASKADLYE